MKNSTFLFILLLVLGYSCKDSNIGDVYVVPENLPAASYMKENPEKYSKWVELLEYTNLYNTLNVDANYTCFVPTNDAVNAFLSEKGVSTVSQLDPEYAKVIVKYHIISGKKLMYAEFRNGDFADTTSTGDKLSIDLGDGGLSDIYVNSYARILNLNIEVANAVIHDIDKVLIPIVETVWDKINPADYSIFKTAIQQTGYDQVLSDKGNKYTLFIVADSIYKKEGINNIDSLVKYVNAADDYTSSANLLNKYIAYHITPQQLSFVELAQFPNDSLSKNLNTLANNELFNIREIDGSLFINYNTNSKKGIRFIKNNTKCKNGFIHSIDQVMPVITPQLAIILWEFTDYSDINNLFPSVYQAANRSSASSNLIEEGDVSCYLWKVMPDENKNFCIRYFVSETASSERYLAKNHDYLLLDNIGLYGWIQMQTPSILKGNYRIKLAYYSPSNKTKKGYIQLSFDNVLFGNSIYTVGNDATTAKYINTTVVGTISFDITTSHTLRILAGDNTSVYLDYILFEPIN